jgi:L-ascorbate metabolism protein UlaG (beta-lactamase superfamily)
LDVTADRPDAAPANENRDAFGPAPFDGRRFSNLGDTEPHGVFDALRWMATRKRTPRPSTIVDDPAPKPLPRVDDGTIRVTLVGHATVLLQVAGLNILTDPVWSKHVGPVSWLGVDRIRAPAITFDDLPEIDIVLLSHNHYDHLDRPTLAALARRDRPLVVTGLKVGRAVPADRVVELDWWQSQPLSERLRATYVPAQHFSARGPFDRNRTLWGGFVLETPGGTVYFAGDTGDGPHFAAIRRRFGPLTLSLLPIGAYEPRWFMAPVHIDPAEAVKASIILESEVSLAIHFGVFPLADDAIDAAPPALALALAAHPAGGRGLDFRLPRLGWPVVVG